MNRIDHLAGGYGEAYEFDVSEGQFSEAEELELAYELLEIASDEELDYFIGKLFQGIKKFGSKAGRILKPLGGMLKGVAKQVLPFAARAAGTFFGGPVGGAVAGKIGSMISSALELELEGMPEEDKQLETARRFVRVARDAAIKAAQASQSAHTASNAASTAQKAMISALKTHFPGMALAHSNPDPQPAEPTEGRWIRRGKQIILLGV